MNAMEHGEYFVTSGEVLIPSYSVEGAGSHRTIVADVQWTFPLEFVEVVWGDGERVDRKIIRTPEAESFGSRHFEIPVDLSKRKWVRLAAWDSAINGAFTQPVELKN